MNRCQCLTSKGIQCLNNSSVKPGTNPKFCWLHQQCLKTIDVKIGFKGGEGLKKSLIKQQPIVKKQAIIKKQPVIKQQQIVNLKPIIKKQRQQKTGKQTEEKGEKQQYDKQRGEKQQGEKHRAEKQQAEKQQTEKQRAEKQQVQELEKQKAQQLEKQAGQESEKQKAQQIEKRKRLEPKKHIIDGYISSPELQKKGFSYYFFYKNDDGIFGPSDEFIRLMQNSLETKRKTKLYNTFTYDGYEIRFWAENPIISRKNIMEDYIIPKYGIYHNYSHSMIEKLVEKLSKIVGNMRLDSLEKKLISYNEIVFDTELPSSFYDEGKTTFLEKRYTKNLNNINFWYTFFLKR